MNFFPYLFQLLVLGKGTYIIPGAAFFAYGYIGRVSKAYVYSLMNAKKRAWLYSFAA